MAFFKITIVRSNKPQTHSINEELQWLGASLGLFGLRDKDKSCFRVFIVLIKNSSQNMGLSSDDIAEMLNLTRGTVVHHLNKLMDAGIVVSERGRYVLRASTLVDLVDNMKKNVAAHLDELSKVAGEIDKRLE